MQNRLCY